MKHGVHKATNADVTYLEHIGLYRYEFRVETLAEQINLRRKVNDARWNIRGFFRKDDSKWWLVLILDRHSNIGHHITPKGIQHAPTAMVVRLTKMREFG